jgi:hypothetical protein
MDSNASAKYSPEIKRSLVIMIAALLPSAIAYLILQAAYFSLPFYVAYAMTATFFGFVKTGIIRKPLAFALLLGALVGCIPALSGYVMAGPGGNTDLGYMLREFGEASGLFIVPAIIGYSARRNYFWWSLFAYIVCLIIGFIGFCVVYHETRDILYMFWEDLPAIGYELIPVFLAAGGISLTRYLAQRNSSQVDGMVNAGKEGAWPPPPAVK